MCGICGVLSVHGGMSAQDLHASTQAMASQLSHRGPDDHGVWTDAAAGIALGHRRLAVVDLSPGGHQPQASACGRYVITFNGEIYNFRELRQELESLGHAFKTRSDTEVALAAFSQWDTAEALNRFNGMFAMGLWDRERRSLMLARDRIGEKPLYYGLHAGKAFFGSQLRPLANFLGAGRRIDRRALALYLRYGYVPAPYSIYEGIRKLRPGTFIVLQGPHLAQHPNETVYWQPIRARARAAGLEQDQATELDALLRDATRRQMTADVPLGAFLSGGMDSSVVVAMMQSQSTMPVRTFTLGFTDQRFDEAPAAREVAAHLRTDHTEFYVAERDVLDVVPQLSAIYDEPFADESQIPTVLVSRLARTQVTVAMSGDGGDELFGGYDRYRMIPALWQRVGGLGGFSKRMLAGLLEGLPSAVMDHGGSLAGVLLNKYGRSGRASDKAGKLAALIRASGDIESMYSTLVSRWAHPEDVTDNAPLADTTLSSLVADLHSSADPADRLMYLDLMTYLPDNSLVKVDRASMSVGLEVRVPLLDYRVVEWAAGLPAGTRTHHPNPKQMLRQVAQRYLPESLLDRPKMGFGAPIADWLRGPLRAWADDLLSRRSLTDSGVLRPDPILVRWEEHTSGKRNWAPSLWTVLMLQEWLRAERREA